MVAKVGVDVGVGVGVGNTVLGGSNDDSASISCITAFSCATSVSIARVVIGTVGVPVSVVPVSVLPVSVVPASVLPMSAAESEVTGVIASASSKSGFSNMTCGNFSSSRGNT
jgi:hypothetical protein